MLKFNPNSRILIWTLFLTHRYSIPAIPCPLVYPATHSNRLIPKGLTDNQTGKKKPFL